MSGVSITSGSIDVDAIVAGGQAFVDRMQAFKDAKETAEQAVADLQLGKDARSALDEAARIRDQAQTDRDAEMDKLLKHVAAIKADTNDWAGQTRAAAMAAREQADADRAAAGKMLDDAKATLNDANAKAADIDAKIAAAKQAFVDAQQAALAKL